MENVLYNSIFVCFVIFALSLSASIIIVVYKNQKYNELKQEHAELKKMYERDAITDELTGIYNRRHIVSRLEVEMNRAQRYSHPLQILFLDLDDLKIINDTEGHKAGDKALIEVAQILKENARDTDIFGRFGGDEFIVIAPGISLESAKKLAQRIQELVGKVKITCDMPLSISIGIYEYCETNGEKPLEAADVALYNAKNGKIKGQIRIFEKTMARPAI